MIAKLLISPLLENRVEEIGKLLMEQNFSQNHPDLIYFADEEKLGVEAAKKIRQHLSLKPYSAEGRIVVVESAHNLTVDAQNSLLKTLEEPPESAIIILGAEKESQLLPTILSRCQLHFLSDQTKSVKASDFTQEIEDLFGKSVEEKFIYIEKLEEKEEFLKALVIFFREKMQQDPKYSYFVKELLKVEEWQNSNVNIRGILEFLMLKMPTSNM